MNRYYYDLHIHSCLSPCGDDDMTPCNIAGMAAVKGLGIAALTDHNTTANCPAFFAACRQHGIVPVAGMELTTAEEIHLVCLFETPDIAADFEKAFDPYRLKIKNRPDIFGEQYIMDSGDNITGKIDFLLPPASALPLDKACELVAAHGGIYYPAHINRPSNGIIMILGDLPEKPYFPCVELQGNEDRDAYIASHPSLAGKIFVSDSDAHYLWDINEAVNYITLDDEPYSSSLVRKRLFEYLRGNTVEGNP